MMTGLPPFYNENLNIMYEKILHAPISLPKYLSKEARSIFLGLLDRDPKRRLGCTDRDAFEIQEHPFYKDIDWNKMYRKELKPPFIPKDLVSDDAASELRKNGIDIRGMDANKEEEKLKMDDGFLIVGSGTLQGGASMIDKGTVSVATPQFGALKSKKKSILM